MLFKLLVLCSFLIVLLQLRRLVNILPSLLACLIRGKESLNLEASVKLSRDRDALALAMIIPFCLATFRYWLYCPGFFEGLFIDKQNKIVNMGCGCEQKNEFVCPVCGGKNEVGDSDSKRCSFCGVIAEGEEVV